MMLATMYAKERHSEFNTKMNYKWVQKIKIKETYAMYNIFPLNDLNRLNVDLQNKQKAADVTNQSIVILLNNILPSHVGQF